MINRLLRRLSVRTRMVGGFLTLVLLMIISVALISANDNYLVNQLQQRSNAEVRAGRSLQSASTNVARSQVNLARYLQDFSPDPSLALDNANQAVTLLQDAQQLTTSAGQKETIGQLINSLGEYLTAIHSLQSSREAGDAQTATSLEAQANSLGNDIGQRIDLLVTDNKNQVDQANQVVFIQVGKNLIIMIVVEAALFVVALFFVLLISQSITQPVSELLHGAEQVRSGRMDTVVPAVGKDELSKLAQAFNQLTSQISMFYRELENRVTERTRDLERRAIELQVAAEVAREAASIRDLKSLLDQTTELISARFGFYHAGIFLIDEAHEYAFLQATNSEGGKRMLERGHKLKVGQVGIVGYVADKGEPRIALDVGADATFFNNPDLPATRSEMALPLKARNEVIGILDVQSTQAEAFAQQDMSVLQILADQIALAIDNVRLIQESQKSIHELEALYAEETRKAWKLRLEHQNMSYLYNRMGVEQALLLPGEKNVPEKTTVVEDGQSRQLVVPIKVRNLELGTVVLKRGPEEEPWGPDDITFVEEAVNQIGQSLENARLVEEVQNRAYQERVLSQITQKAQGSLDLDTIIKTAVQEIGLAMNAARVQIRLGTPSTPVEPPGDGRKLSRS